MPFKKDTEILKKYMENMINCSKYLVYKMPRNFRFNVVSQKHLKKHSQIMIQTWKNVIWCTKATESCLGEGGKVISAVVLAHRGKNGW